MNKNLVSKLISINPNKRLYNNYIYNIQKGMDSNIATQLFLKTFNTCTSEKEALYYLSLLTLRLLQLKYGLEDSIILKKIDALKNNEDIIRSVEEHLQEVGVTEKNLIFNINKNIGIIKDNKIKKLLPTNKNWNLWDVYYLEINKEMYVNNFFRKKVLYIQKCGTFDFGSLMPITYFKIGDINKIPMTKEEYNKLEYIQINSNFYDERLLPFDNQKNLEEHIKEKEAIHYPTNEFGYLPVYRLAIWKSGKHVPANLKFLGNFQDPVLPEKEYIHNNGKETMFQNWDTLLKRVVENYFLHNMRRSPIYSPDYKRQFTVQELVKNIRVVDKDHVIK